MISPYIFLQDHQSIGQNQGMPAQVREFGGQRGMAAYYGTVVFLATLDCVEQIIETVNFLYQY